MLTEASVCLPGEIRSPGWDGKTLYPPGVDAWVRLNVPSQHAVMLSFLAWDVWDLKNLLHACHAAMDHIEITFRMQSSGDLNIMSCFKDPLKGKVYFADIVSVRLYTNWNKLRATGFRLLYSFHRQGQTPERNADGRWNCSVPFWDSIKDHFPCDLEAECVGAEDEKDCPYSSPLCAPGEFFLGHSCYIYVKRRSQITWDFASAQCQIRTGHLVSFNDMAEWRDLMKLLREHDVKPVFVGLSTATLSLPQM